jgi:hypothetical protein
MMPAKLGRSNMDWTQANTPIFVGIHVRFGMLIVQKHTGYRNVCHPDARANEKLAGIWRN